MLPGNHRYYQDIHGPDDVYACRFSISYRDPNRPSAIETGDLHGFFPETEDATLFGYASKDIFELPSDCEPDEESPLLGRIAMAMDSSSKVERAFGKVIGVQDEFVILQISDWVRQEKCFQLEGFWSSLFGTYDAMLNSKEIVSLHKN